MTFEVFPSTVSIVSIALLLLPIATVCLRAGPGRNTRHRNKSSAEVSAAFIMFYFINDVNESNLILFFLLENVFINNLAKSIFYFNQFVSKCSRNEPKKNKVENYEENT